MKRSALVGLYTALILTLVGLAGCTGASPTPTATLTTAPTAATTPSAVAGAVTPGAVSTIATPSATSTAGSSPQPSPSAAGNPTAVAAPTQPVLKPEDFPRPPTRDFLDVARRFKGGPTTVATPSIPPRYKVGDQHTFWLLDQKTRKPYQLSARIAYITDHTYMYVADGVTVSTAALKASADTFETETYPLLHKDFGSEASPGIDNDVHVTILNAHIPFVGGYFSSPDTYPRWAYQYSNEREMFCINVDSYAPGTASYDSTLAHEFTHMIQENTMAGGTGGGETWISEGSAELGALAAGQQAGGLDLLFLRNPDLQLTQWADLVESPSQASAHYGAAYLFMVYYAQHFGGYEAVGKLLAGDGLGEASFDAHLASRGLNTTFESIFKDWVVANYLDDKSIADGRYGYDERRSEHASVETVRGLPYRSSTTVNQFGADYYALQSQRGDLTISFDGREDAQLLDLGAHGGKVQWWSNRGDKIDSRLTRNVDLSGVTKATLRFWTWYDLEKDYDYAYVAVSTDGGQTWKPVPGTHTITDNPNGANLGSGFTGKSGGTKPAWVQETMDLSPYAGKQILLRLEYITDDALNYQGIGFDDLEIPEIGWRDGAEGQGDWVAEGFVRTDNQLDQRFAVQVITKGKATKVQSMDLDAQDKGQLVIRNVGPGQDVESVVVVVSGLAPLTIRPAEYQISTAMAQATPTPKGSA